MDEIIQKLKDIAVYSDISSKHAAAIIYKNQMINCDINKYLFYGKSCIRDKVNTTIDIGDNKIYYKTIHAEISVLHKLPKKNIPYKKFDIIVIRTNN